MPLTRRTVIDGNQLLVLDGLFSEPDIASLYKFLNRLPYHLNDIDTTQTAYAPHWKAELLIDFVRATPVLKDCLPVAPEMFPRDNLRLERVHVNLHMYGDIQFPHVDLPGGVTLLYYANPEWKENWMGETIFYDGNRDPVAAVAPRPGRVVIFDGDLLHRGGVPSRECFGPRVTIAFKYRREPTDAASGGAPPRPSPRSS